ncbi:hypothetical protein GH714_021542 [Hevea brasiliensis]|uniref:Uncharacterized protein n=1 Tax=Hevea brasiliensis TaxID=3981 RepID=A0A6A6MLY0_HEVBR|nr:hypothetical protein GH714_021542 [Hevea brasiliensis]
MGCFLGCFGLSCKGKRRKPANRVQHGDHGFGSYEPLDSTSTVLDITGEPINSELRRKNKEQLNCKIRKKVSFNLNVRSYEPIPNEESTDHLWKTEEDENKEEISKETTKEDQSPSLAEGDLIATKMAPYPSNYRYRNCIDSYDEEYEESNLDDDDDDFDEDDESGGDIDDMGISQEEFSEKLMSLSASSNKRESSTEFSEETSENLKPLGDLNEGGLKSIGMNRNSRSRSQYVHSVLNPVENLSQWKAVKAKGMSPVKCHRKENIALEQQVRKHTPPMQEIAVDASLSNWLFSSDSCQSRATSITKSSTIPVQTTSKKSSFGSTFSGRGREDMPT